MILLVHMLFGAAIGASIKVFPLAILLAFLGHYFLDLFPHIEYLDGVENSIQSLKSDAWSKKIKDILKAFLDFFLGIVLIFLFSKNQPIVYICALAAILPDGLTIVHSLFPKLGLAPHHHIHGTRIHYLTKQKKFPIFWKIATQVLVVIVSIGFLKS